ncbi:uncharacterized protein L3040_000599 [Drepanopeziza brunnea f. sp. 'multigermtubi']|uniref:UBX domain-containing protein n=1 Tax=Marssonina brunnea f. sp. multigermtubi (strain MB_m1) TaxID=1072389 RepID=K1WUK5_MARBU|nr:uncharacterized protein MBM_00478 [Drepanopeziza brunnea f. sp. 'multigermtubi' MB_m1]EKD21365.1 hypothetical protein MBM_00478 [Drepanopeziza brunnea f. sp. 'multigermtubi' MB_m1]KAJ5054323.1 hypothetical protein L3040_000599 [Drepanopeziza brunnea f. sp. 'multigermtubi']
MASNVVVIDSSFRRTVIKVNPGTYMTDVLEQACKKFNLDASRYGLKNNNKAVNLSSPYRQTGLVPGAKLELVLVSRSPSVVSVALQLPESLAKDVPGGRLVDKFPSDTTLWLVLRKFESRQDGPTQNFTGRGAAQIEKGASGAGRIFYEMPSLNLMGREVSDFGGLQKTLAQLGFNQGSVSIRLGFKQTEQPLEEAMKEIGQYFKEDEEPKSSEDPKTEAVTDAIAKLPEASVDPGIVMGDTEDLISFDQVEDAATHPAPGPESPQQLLGPNHRPITVYAAPTADTPKAALRPHIDNDFEPTIAHAKLHQSRLQENAMNKRLPSDAEQERLDKEKAAKLAKKTSVNIKVRFPDETSIIASFTAAETGLNLYEHVKGTIAAEEQPFKLVYQDRGPQTVPRNEKKLIRDLGFEGGVTVNFIWEDAASDEVRDRRRSVLKGQYVAAAKEIPVPELVADEMEDGKVESVEQGKGKERTGGGKGGMPKWLKGFGKK